MILGDEVVKLLVLRCVFFHGLKDELGPTGEAYHPHPKTHTPFQAAIVGSGCFVWHLGEISRLLSSKAQ